MNDKIRKLEAEVERLQEKIETEKNKECKRKRDAIMKSWPEWKRNMVCLWRPNK